MYASSRRAAQKLLSLTDAQCSAVILTLATLLESRRAELLEANSADLSRMDPANPLYDRLKLTDARIDEIASALRHVASLASPVGEIVEERTLPNGLELRRVRVPYGVIGVIYEARPNVTFDVFALCMKSGNACILKSGRDAEQSTLAAIHLIRDALMAHSLDPDTAVLLPATHEATAEMLSAVGDIDVVIPRGGRNLIDFVRRTAKVPVIETGAGVVHTYFDRAGLLEIGIPVVTNAKTRRVSVCNALDTLLIARSRLADLPALVAPLADKNVEIHADREAYEALRDSYPSELLRHADPSSDWDTEWMSLKMGIVTVDDVNDALAHISRHGSGHSESIITEDPLAAERFLCMADASCVYLNAPTSFTDGAQFGLGAEIGISTQKLGPRGPMGLREICTTKYLITGRGQTRP